MLLHKVIEKFIHNLITTDKSKETIKSYTTDLSTFENFIYAKYNCPMYITDLEVPDIEDYLYSLKLKNLSTASRSRHLYTLRSLWNYAYKNKLCKWNIAMGVEPIKIQKKERTYLSAEEVNELIGAIDHTLINLVIQTLFYTGMRISECLNLQIANVNFENKTIHVIAGKGNKNRNIPINDHLLILLKDYLNNDRPEIDSNYFFATKRSGKLSSAYVNRILNETVKNLGWNKHVTPHILRHSFASNLIKNGVNLVHVQKLLGHSNLKVTSIYTHANFDELGESVNTL
ncbi:tyrosine-type recombinase/integrase [Oceanirhabdus seepicola]|uniref:Tyrosine-type recombinase/integrase n=1 Tax=Oceanirhabdus seepicola TaxID=2828781 RepID=A0A9J6P2H7_9CLOT|nr:tyrosine-type recombinase/integrase [Oceanirhabdus seepicola]MCM1990265.1 tyrosine-type recombinase/integrase [Oceanirhabdus seepicola]